MLDQAASLRKLVAEKSYNSQEIKYGKIPKILTVTSGKGGVGKSNFVVNLAITLQKSGKKVLILDTDIGMANDDILMGFFPKYDIGHILFNNMPLEQVIIEGPFGVKLLPGGSGMTKLNEITDEIRENFIRKISNLRDLDFIIIDTGAGADYKVLRFISCSEELILLTTPEPTALTDAYSLLKLVSHFDIKSNAKVVVNKALNSKEALNTFNKFNNTSKKFLGIDLDYLGFIMEDRKVIEAVRKQRPFVLSFPNSYATKNIESIANSLIKNRGYIKEKSKDSSIQGFFKRMFNAFKA
ncbi:MinD/ParA family protein [Clostridium cochlearium]|uniref:MinD/ParA family protein n=1 Tax=Clostridium cochlearium TaxID=1494 RepID=UPI000BBC6585|nr:MinD/ParA family protein [Clostridium cochlearium]